MAKEKSESTKASVCNYQRILQIDKIIASGSNPTIQDIINKLKQKSYRASRATVYRDLRILKDEFHAPLKFNEATNGYIYTEESFRIPALLTTENQIKAARVIRNLLGAIKGTPLYEDALDVFNTLSTVAPTRNNIGQAFKDTNLVDDENNEIVFLGAPSISFSKEVWETIKDAISNKNYIKFTYTTSFENSTEKKRAMEPWQLIFSNGTWYVWGKDTHDKKRKLFTVAGITNIELVKETFKKPNDFDFMATTPGTFGCYTNDEYLTYSIKLTGYAAKRAKLKTWGNNQTVTENGDGSITITFESNQYDPIVTWVMSWGGDAVPLSPPVLVQDWKNRVEETYRVMREESK